MIVKSFLVYVAKGSVEKVSQKITSIQGCETTTADNHDLLVLVLEVRNREEENEIIQKLSTINDILNMSLVSVYS